jgi:geranylgeranyl reductase
MSNSTPVASVHLSSSTRPFDAVIVGGGPSGATAAHELAKAGKSVVLLDKAGRIKPCGGAIPPRLIKDFGIPDDLICARIRAARMVSPSEKKVDMPIDGGFVAMVNRETFDEYLRTRAADAGALRITGTYERLERDGKDGTIVHYETPAGPASVRAKLVIGADGALSKVRQEVKAAPPPCVFAYHEVLEVPEGDELGEYEAGRADVIYDGRISPDFYGWVFPHGKTASVGTGSAQKVSLRKRTAALREQSGTADWKMIRREGAPIPMKPMKRWDNGEDVVLAGDAAGVVAPSSGEGIYYAMVGGQVAAEAGLAFLETGDAAALKLARKKFMKAHGRVFFILGIMQYFWYSSDKRRERFVAICRDRDVQELTWQAYMNKELVRAKPMAHARIFFKDVGHLVGIGRA